MEGKIGYRRVKEERGVPREVKEEKVLVEGVGEGPGNVIRVVGKGK